MFQASNITPADKIEAELNEMSGFLELPYNADNPNELKERLVVLSQHMARSGVLKAHAEHNYFAVYNSAVMGALKQLAESNMGISTVNKFIESSCRDYKVLVIMSDRVNRATVHQSDAIRTLISYAKQERQYL